MGAGDDGVGVVEYAQSICQDVTMPRQCSICAHPAKAEIDLALVAGQPYRSIAQRFEASPDAVYRHLQGHLPATLLKAQEVEEVVEATNLMKELERCFQRVNLLFDACDRWLRDVDDPSQYDIGPRAEDVSVTYMVMGDDDKPHRQKARLSELLARIEGRGYGVELVETKQADPRDLLLKTAKQLQGQVELLAKLLGELKEGQIVNIFMSAEWVSLRTVILTTLEQYPEARHAVAGALNGHTG